MVSFSPTSIKQHVANGCGRRNESGLDEKGPAEKASMEKEECGPRALVCQGVSPWDEPCGLLVTDRYEVVAISDGKTRFEPR